MNHSILVHRNKQLHPLDHVHILQKGCYKTEKNLNYTFQRNVGQAQRIIEQQQKEKQFIVKYSVSIPKNTDTYRGTERSGFLWFCRTFQMINGRTITIASHHETMISCSCLIYAVDATTRQKRMTNARETLRMRNAYNSCNKSFLAYLQPPSAVMIDIFAKCSSYAFQFSIYFF